MARMITVDQTTTTTNIVTTSNSTPVDVSRAKLLSLQAVVDVNTPAAFTFVDGDVSVANNTVTETAHGLQTGLKGQLTSGGTLPAGLSLATDYFIIATDANTVKFATSLANAQAGTAVDITAAAGGGTHTFTPTSIAGASITLQKSNDYDPVTASGTWDAVEAATAISADGDIWISDIDPEYRYVRHQYTLTAGRLSASTRLIVKQDL